MIYTSQQSNFDSNKEEGQDEVTSSHHITVWECKDSYSGMEPAKTRKALEEGGQATADDLK